MTSHQEDTTMIEPSMTVAEIVQRHPEARPILARFGLDTCCGGKHPLEFACRAHKVPVEEVLAALRAAAGAAAVVIDAGMCVREVLAAHPSTLPVFERHGLMGCGGSQGPVEPLGWFARVHHVDLPQLLAELHEAARTGATPAGEPGPITPAALAHENLYRRFLKAAFLFTFSGGAALGTCALILMAVRGQLGGLGHGLIQVHGHYQLFGWVGLFVVGVAYHILPHLTGVPLPSYRLASLSFVLLVCGTILRAAQMLDPSALRAVLLYGGALAELFGCGLFAWTVGRILRAQPGPFKAYQGYLAIGTGFLLVAGLLNVVHVGYLAARAAIEVPPYLNIPYLSIFLVGFVIFWILGVSLRTLPVFMGLRTRPRVAAATAPPLAVAAVIMTVGETAYLAGGGIAARLAFGLGGLLVSTGFVVFTWSLGILGRPTGEPEPGLDRGYEKFLRLGYAWLLISAAILGVFSVLAVASRNMDHALVGAYRHALTVGFITTIMVGMASRIIPVFRGVPLHSARMREWTFWLLLAGNLIRVLFQSLSAAFGPAMLRVAGVSGVMELTALLLFAINIWKTLDAATPEEAAVADRRPPIAAETKVGALLAAYPGLLPIFLSAGFTAVANPLMRRTVARGVSIAQACRMHGVDLQGFLARLAEGRARLPV
jgi:Domain of unknown function (DUF1858)/Domain of Unknown function (DUF542)/NnrS protein